MRHVKYFCIAGIGSRQTPIAGQESIINFTHELLRRYENLWIRSGHAVGADYAFEKAAKDRCIAYLPFPRFGERDGLTLQTRNVVLWNEADPEAQRRAIRSVERLHPAFEYLKPGQIRCLARDYFQVFGSKRNIDPVKAVVCWANIDKTGQILGGTAQAARLADEAGIPVYNLNTVRSSYVLDDLSRILEA